VGIGRAAEGFSIFDIFRSDLRESSSSTSAVAGRGENLDEASYKKLEVMGFYPWVRQFKARSIESWMGHALLRVSRRNK
jgi:hypothetical protein